jgi:hypothetical protein
MNDAAMADPGDEMILLMVCPKKTIQQISIATHLPSTRKVNDHLKGLHEIEVITPLPVPGQNTNFLVIASPSQNNTLLGLYQGACCLNLFNDNAISVRAVTVVCSRIGLNRLLSDLICILIYHYPKNPCF